MCLFNKNKSGKRRADKATPAAPDTLEQEAPTLVRGSSDGTGMSAYRLDGGSGNRMSIRGKRRERGQSTNVNGAGLTIGGVNEDTKSGLGIGK